MEEHFGQKTFAIITIPCFKMIRPATEAAGVHDTPEIAPFFPEGVPGQSAVDYFQSSAGLPSSPNSRVRLR